MSPRATSTRTPRPRCWPSCVGRSPNSASPSSWSPTTPMARPTPTGSFFWATARSSTTSPRRRPTRSSSTSERWAPDVWRVTIKGLLAHKLRLALTALAIVLGVTFIAGTLVLTDTLHNTFDTLFGNIYQNVDFQVRGVAQFGSGGTATRNPVPESLVATVRAVPGVQAAEGSVEGYAQYIAPDGTS